MFCGVTPLNGAVTNQVPPDVEMEIDWPVGLLVRLKHAAAGGLDPI